MKVNESNVDRIIRVVVGAGLAYAGFSSLLGSWSWLGIVFGVVFILTGAVGFCPLYTLFKFKTN